METTTKQLSKNEFIHELYIVLNYRENINIMLDVTLEFPKVEKDVRKTHPYKGRFKSSVKYEYDVNIFIPDNFIFFIDSIKKRTKITKEFFLAAENSDVKYLLNTQDRSFEVIPEFKNLSVENAEEYFEFLSERQKKVIAKKDKEFKKKFKTLLAA